MSVMRSTERDSSRLRFAHIGGYRTSSATQCKLRRVTGTKGLLAADRRVCVCQWPMRVHPAVAHIAPFDAHPGRAWPFIPHPEVAILRQGYGTWGSPIEGLARVMGQGLRPPAGPLLSAGGRADAGCRATVRPLAAARGFRPRTGARSATVLACTARPSVPPIRTLLTRQRPCDGQELIPRPTSHSGPADGGRRGVWAFRRRPSAAARRRRSASILAVWVVPRRRKAAHRDVRIAMFATAAQCRQGRRWPAACRQS